MEPNSVEGQKSFPGGHSEVAPPDPIPNSEVKRFSADDSLGSPHAKVGHCQVLITQKYPALVVGYFFVLKTSWCSTFAWHGEFAKQTFPR